MPARGKGCLDCHNAVQTIQQGQGGAVGAEGAWRPLALLPLLKASACAETDKDWLVHRCLDLYHCSMDHVIADLNELCSKDILSYDIIHDIIRHIVPTIGKNSPKTYDIVGQNL